MSTHDSLQYFRGATPGYPAIHSLTNVSVQGASSVQQELHRTHDAATRQCMLYICILYRYCSSFKITPVLVLEQQSSLSCSGSQSGKRAGRPHPGKSARAAKRAQRGQEGYIAFSGSFLHQTLPLRLYNWVMPPASCMIHCASCIMQDASCMMNAA